jgi:hypothetical protein
MSIALVRGLHGGGARRWAAANLSGSYGVIILDDGISQTCKRVHGDAQPDQNIRIIAALLDIGAIARQRPTGQRLHDTKVQWKIAPRQQVSATRRISEQSSPRDALQHGAIDPLEPLT